MFTMGVDVISEVLNGIFMQDCESVIDIAVADMRLGRYTVL